MNDTLPTEQFDTEWTNYGDMNPEPNGGRFVRWDDDDGSWDIVTTDKAMHVVADEDNPDKQMVSEYEVHSDDVWVNGDPDEGFTDHMVSILDSFSHDHHKAAPGGKPFMNKVQYYVADMSHKLSSRWKYEVIGEDYDTYDEMLSAYGVDSYE